MTTESLFLEMEKLTNQNIETTKSKMLNLSKEQLSWRPKLDSWNLLEIYAHLNEYAKFYHSAFSKKIDTTRFREPRDIFISSPLGKSAWKSMKLGNAQNVKRKFKAPKLYNPTIVPSIIRENTLQEFIDGQKVLLEILKNARTINIRKSKIGISLSKIVRLRFGDALMFVIYHNERHIQQALNLINHKNFPSS